MYFVCLRVHSTDLRNRIFIIFIFRWIKYRLRVWIHLFNLSNFFKFYSIHLRIFLILAIFLILVHFSVFRIGYALNLLFSILRCLRNLITFKIQLLLSRSILFCFFNLNHSLDLYTWYLRLWLLLISIIVVFTSVQKFKWLSFSGAINVHTKLRQRIVI